MQTIDFKESMAKKPNFRNHFAEMITHFLLFTIYSLFPRYLIVELVDTPAMLGPWVLPARSLSTVADDMRRLRT